MAALADRLFASFDHVAIVNLASRPDRRAEMARELAGIGTGFDDPRIRLFEGIRPDEAGGFRSVGARGCFLSHLGVLRDALLAGHQRIVLFEDDLDFAPGIDRLLPSALDALDRRGFGIFYGGYAVPDVEEGGPVLKKPLIAVPPDLPVRQAHFVGFERGTIERLVPYLELMAARPAGSSAGGPMDIDEAYGWFRAAHPDLMTWLAHPQLGVQRPSAADVDAPGLLDRLPLPRPARRAVRAVSRVWRRPS